MRWWSHTSSCDLMITEGGHGRRANPSGYQPSWSKAAKKALTVKFVETARKREADAAVQTRSTGDDRVSTRSSKSSSTPNSSGWPVEGPYASSVRLTVSYFKPSPVPFVDHIQDIRGRPIFPQSRRHVLDGMVYNRASRSLHPPYPSPRNSTTTTSRLRQTLASVTALHSMGASATSVAGSFRDRFSTTPRTDPYFDDPSQDPDMRSTRDMSYLRVDDPRFPPPLIRPSYWASTFYAGDLTRRGITIKPIPEKATSRTKADMRRDSSKRPSVTELASRRMSIEKSKKRFREGVSPKRKDSVRRSSAASQKSTLNTSNTIVQSREQNRAPSPADSEWSCGVVSLSSTPIVFPDDEASSGSNSSVSTRRYSIELSPHRVSIITPSHKQSQGIASSSPDILLTVSTSRQSRPSSQIRQASITPPIKRYSSSSPNMADTKQNTLPFNSSPDCLSIPSRPGSMKFDIPRSSSRQSSHGSDACSQRSPLSLSPIEVLPAHILAERSQAFSPRRHSRLLSPGPVLPTTTEE